MSVTNSQPDESAILDSAMATRLLQDWWAEMGVSGDAPASASARQDKPKQKPPSPASRTGTPLAASKSLAFSASAPAPALAAGSLEALKAAIEAAEGCALKAGARATVFARGRPESGLMLIGEAPGRDEDAQGLPFVGRAGQLLDKMFAAIGRERESGLYISNLLPWRPPSNRDPTPDEVAFCRPFLLRHIELVAPKLLVTAGRFATHSLLATDQAMTRLRGREHTYQHEGFGPVPCIPIMHPAYLLRRPQDKARAWKDMRVIAATAKRLGLVIPDAPASTDTPASTR